MFTPNREQVRKFLMEAWRKRRASQPASALETIAADIVAEHPEYHALLQSGEDALDKDWLPDSGETNPFLHLSLHLAIAEQLQVNQPPGILPAYEALRKQLGDNHQALHKLVECLGETIWRAQREQKPLDGEAYIASIRKAAGIVS